MRYRQDDNRIIYSIIRIVLAMFATVLSIFAVLTVFNHIANYPFLKQFVIKEEAPRINITVDNSIDSNSMFVSDEKGLRFRKSDKSFARDEWIDKNGELFYFDLSSYGKEGSMRYDGQVYYFENGKLKRIARDTAEPSKKAEYFNGIDSLQYFVYLDNNDEVINNNYAIKYIKYSDDETDFLGTKNDKQYCRPNFLKVNMSYIYYLATGLGNNSSGKLYRMVPNAQTKETVGNKVEGYIVLSDDVVYYYNGNIVVKVKSWTKENVKYIDEENIFDDALNSVPIDELETIRPGVYVPGNGMPIDRDAVLVDSPKESENKDKLIINDTTITEVAKTVENDERKIDETTSRDSNAPRNSKDLVVPIIEHTTEDVIIGQGPNTRNNMSPDLVLPEVVVR